MCTNRHNFICIGIHRILEQNGCTYVLIVGRRVCFSGIYVLSDGSKTDVGKIGFIHRISYPSFVKLHGLSPLFIYLNFEITEIIPRLIGR